MNKIWLFSRSERDNMNGRQTGTTQNRRGLRRSRLAVTLAAALVGGSMLSTCDTRLRDAVVSGSKQYFFGLLSPDAIVEALFGSQNTPGQ